MSASTAEELLAIVQARKKQVRKATGVWVWTRSNGRMRARGFTTSQYQPVPPHFVGRFVAGEPDGQLVGSIRESWLQLLILRTFGFAALLSAFGAVVIVAGGWFTLGGFLVCTVGALGLGWLAYVLGRGRTGDFTTGAEELKRALTRLVPPTPGKRSRRSKRG